MRRSTWAGFLIGFSIGGFFDGIPLHQILQWHHLLSLVDSPLVQDIRVQILADGLFHALMYLLAVMGLYLLWRTREQLALASAGRWQLAAALLGFGVWNISDAAAFHWILQIHRIRIESSASLIWDLIWFAVFGLAFTFAGWKLRLQVCSGGPSSQNGVTGSASVGCLSRLPVPAQGLHSCRFKNIISQYMPTDSADCAPLQCRYAAN